MLKVKMPVPSHFLHLMKPDETKVYLATPVIEHAHHTLPYIQQPCLQEQFEPQTIIMREELPMRCVSGNLYHAPPHASPGTDNGGCGHSRAFLLHKELWERGLEGLRWGEQLLGG